MRVQELMEDPDGPPPLLKDMEIDETDVARLTVALMAMLGRVMVTEVTDSSPHDLDIGIKVRRCALLHTHLVCFSLM